MCLIIDDREDDALKRALNAREIALAVTRLEYGDAAFEGAGPKGPCMVGFERKHLSDLCNSMTERRLTGHQLAGMAHNYDYCYLVIEDQWQADAAGYLEVFRQGRMQPLHRGQRGLTYEQVDGYLSSLELRANVIVCRTRNTRETADFYISRFKHWQKPWHEHHSHDAIYRRDPSSPLHRGKPSFASREPGVPELFAAILPGIDRKAWDVAKHFPTAEDIVLASEEDWKRAQIPGIGPKTIEKIITLKGFKRGSNGPNIKPVQNTP